VFITLEGVDGSGKTTQSALLVEALGEDTVRIREPGGTQAAEQVRSLLADPGVPLDPVAELLLFCAARADLISRVIKPGIAEGRHVVCDRYTDSTLAYQGGARGLGVDRVRAVNRIATGELSPDLTLLLKVDPKAGLERAESDDRFEAEGVRFQEIVAETYEAIAAAEPERVVAVDAAGTPEEVHERIMEVVRARLGS